MLLAAKPDACEPNTINDLQVVVPEIFDTEDREALLPWLS
jgi:hypothetical protein